MRRLGITVLLLIAAAVLVLLTWNGPRTENNGSGPVEKSTAGVANGTLSRLVVADPELCEVTVRTEGVPSARKGMICVADGNGQQIVGFPNCTPLSGSAASENVAIADKAALTRSAVWILFGGATAVPAIAWPSECGAQLLFTLVSGVTTTGIVQDNAGGVVSGALISSSAGMAVSDDEGRFALSSPRDRRFIDITAHATGYASTKTRTSVGRRDLELFLTPESVIRGRVEDVNGAPQAGVVINAVGSPTLSTQTEPSGNYELHGLRPGTYMVTGSAVGLRATSAEPVVVGFATIVDGVNLVLKPAPTLIGHVVLADGNPCSMGKVELRSVLGLDFTREVDSSGHVTFDDLQPGRYDVSVHCAGYAKSEFPPVDIRVERRDIQWSVQTGKKIFLRVLTADREAAEEVQVDILDSNHRLVSSVTTDHGGEATAAGLSEDRVQAIVESKKGDGASWIETAKDPSRATEIVLGRSSFGAITGTLRLRGDSGGAAISVVAKGSERAYIALLEPDDSFKLDVPAGVYELFAHFSLSADAAKDAPRSTSVTATVSPGEVYGPVELDLEAVTVVMHGEVRDSDGSPAADVVVTVRAIEDLYFRREALTAGDGGFSLAGLLATWRYRVVATSPDGRTVELADVTPGAKMALSLPKSRRLCGNVKDDADRPVSAFRVTLVSPLAARTFEFARGDGTWCVPEVGEAKELLIQADAGAALQDIRENEISTRLAGFAPVNGRLLGPDGVPVVGAMLWLSMPGVNIPLGPAAESDVEGRFHLEGPRGVFDLILEPFGELRSFRGKQSVRLPGEGIEIRLGAAP